MANNLEVSGECLRATATSGESAAAELTAAGTLVAGGSDAAGIASLDAAVGAAQSRQAQHLSAAATSVRTADVRYDQTDTHAAVAINATL